MSLATMWTHWATIVVLAIAHGDLVLLRLMIKMALAISLATLASLGIKYGPRVA